jgi:hypothetical protein
VADEVIDSEEDLEWQAEEELSTSRGPYSLPPPRRDAARESEVADPTYVPATTAEGLKKVGGLADWWSKPENWRAGGDFAGFRPREKVTDPALIEASVRRAVIEALALRDVGRDDDLVGVWPTTISKADLERLLSWNVKGVENGAVSLGGDASTVAEELRWKDEEVAFAGGVPEALTSEEAGALSQTWDPNWKSISLVDPRLRFAVCFHLTYATSILLHLTQTSD